MIPELFSFFIFILASTILLQIKIVEDACIGYLQQLNLPAEQLMYMMRLWDKLMLYEARRQTLQLHAHKAWIGNNLQTLPVLFEELVHAGSQEIDLCKEVLFSSECGALCKLQARPLFHLDAIVSLQMPSCVCLLAIALYGIAFLQHAPKLSWLPFVTYLLQVPACRTACKGFCVKVLHCGFACNMCTA